MVLTFAAFSPQYNIQYNIALLPPCAFFPIIKSRVEFCTEINLLRASRELHSVANKWSRGTFDLKANCPMHV